MLACGSRLGYRFLISLREIIIPNNMFLIRQNRFLHLPHRRWSLQQTNPPSPQQRSLPQRALPFPRLDLSHRRTQSTFSPISFGRSGRGRWPVIFDRFATERVLRFISCIRCVLVFLRAAECFFVFFERFRTEETFRRTRTRFLLSRW